MKQLFLRTPQTIRVPSFCTARVSGYLRAHQAAQGDRLPLLEALVRGTASPIREGRAQCARELAAPIVLDVHRNPNANHRELWVRDPDGYTVVLASPDGDAEET